MTRGWYTVKQGGSSKANTRSTPQKGWGNMNFILWLIIGGILGWIASLIMGTDEQQGVFLNIVVGVIGALLAGFLLTPLFGVGTINQSNFSLPALFVSLLGAIILLAIVNLFRRGTVRSGLEQVSKG